MLLVERVERQIGGVAYSTGSASHTLNVPAGRMSAIVDDPDDFLRFVRAAEPSLTGGSFVPRRSSASTSRRGSTRRAARPTSRCSGSRVRS